LAIVEVTHLIKNYLQGNTEVFALRDVTLSIEQGEFMAIAGPSGSGKTTLLNLIGGLDLPTSGRIAIEGTNIGQLTARDRSHVRRDRIGFIFQSFNLIPVLTALENAEFVLVLQGVPEPERHRRVYALFSEIGMSGLENRFPNELSGGQQQRVAIARAIVAKPAIILADEPTANLDSKTAVALLETMYKLNQTQGSTFVFSTHDPHVMGMAGRVVHLVDGQITQIETKNEGHRGKQHP
jgi:putative ABC transport system ATP-binding protein